MGSLTSRPKAPQPTTQVVYAAPATTSSASSSSSGTVTTQADEKEIAATRVENVLRRKRSISGNVLTSLRGILGAGDSALTRKTLLGE